MKLSYVFIVNALFASIGGLGCLLAPQQLMAPYGGTLSDAGAFITQIMGGLLVGIAILSFMARNSTQSQAQKAILAGFTTAHVLTGLVSLYALVTGRLGGPLIVDVVAHSLLALGFGYYLFIKKPTTVATA